MAPNNCRALARGDYAASTKSDLRSPCPLLNCLANHGYLPRNGRDVDPETLTAGLRHVAISPLLTSILVQPTYIDHDEPRRAQTSGFWARLWRFLRNPYTALDQNALWYGDYRHGRKVITLDQLKLHGAIEHDVSLTRRDWDHGRGDANRPDRALVEEMLAYSQDGGRTLTADDLIRYRRDRIEGKGAEAVYGAHEHQFACGNIAMVLKVLGNGESVPCAYVRAFFDEERLPVREGWKPRWWSVGLFEIMWTARWIKQLIGLKIE